MSAELPEIKHRPEVDPGAVDVTFPDGTRIDLMVEGGEVTVFETFVSQRVRRLAVAAASSGGES